MKTLDNLLGQARPLSIPFLRVVLAFIMFWHGYRKFDDGINGTEAFFDFLSIPLPGVAARAIALLEVVGGLAILAGVATRLVSVLFVIELLFATFLYKYGEGVGFIGADQAGAELDWALIAGFVVLACHGAGVWSLDDSSRVRRIKPSWNLTANDHGALRAPERVVDPTTGVDAIGRLSNPKTPGHGVERI